MVQTSLVRNGSLVKPPTFTSVEAERRHRQERLAAALRVFAQFGFAPGLAGHITARDPELTDSDAHAWKGRKGKDAPNVQSIVTEAVANVSEKLSLA